MTLMRSRASSAVRTSSTFLVLNLAILFFAMPAKFVNPKEKNYFSHHKNSIFFLAIRWAGA
ncbi:hypothetical protein BpHYR1_003611 [Brachionus plicatilis]|uniref:Uncharacterized protein n=1 Tax=Brachionus plicatilis TaxID=10195 RepID=A0A3M7PFV1_BRAPC|nr:hypothetical protein BpHYR1_003611 [Brachionus plicatilis]